MGQLERIQLLQRFIDEEPNEPFNKYALAMEYYETDPSKSLSLLQILLKEHPNYLPSYYKTGHLLWENEDLNEAESIFLKGIQLAEHASDLKTLAELKSSLQNLQFELD